MQSEFWHNAWGNNKTGWQQSRVNSRLQRFWPDLGMATGASVLVPLCGDSIDMAWLLEQGYQVVGAELSRKAVEQFFDTHGLTPDRTQSGEHTLYGCDNLRIFCGDFLTLQTGQTGPLDAVYDRAATVAMPDALRGRYAAQLQALLAPGTPLILISMSYDQDKMKGPPFSVPAQDVRRIYEQGFTIEVLGGASGPEILGNLADRGLDELEETVYKLVRKAPA